MKRTLKNIILSVLAVWTVSCTGGGLNIGDLDGAGNIPADYEALSLYAESLDGIVSVDAHWLGNDLGNIAKLAGKGFVYITLSHQGDNQVCNSCNSTSDPSAGLTGFGREVVTKPETAQEARNYVNWKDLADSVISESESDRRTDIKSLLSLNYETEFI